MSELIKKAANAINKQKPNNDINTIARFVNAINPYRLRSPGLLLQL